MLGVSASGRRQWWSFVCGSNACIYCYIKYRGEKEKRGYCCVPYLCLRARREGDESEKWAPTFSFPPMQADTGDGGKVCLHQDPKLTHCTHYARWPFWGKQTEREKEVTRFVGHFCERTMQVFLGDPASLSFFKGFLCAGRLNLGEVTVTMDDSSPALAYARRDLSSPQIWCLIRPKHSLPPCWRLRHISWH